MAGHDLDPTKDQNFYNSLSLKDAAKVSGAGYASYEAEFIKRQVFIPYSYDVTPEGKFGAGGKMIEDMIDPNEVGADRLQSVLDIAETMHNNLDIQEAWFHSPDLGYGRDFLYGISRTGEALAVEYHGDNEDRQHLREQFGRNAINPEAASAANVLAPFYLTEKLSTQSIVQIVESSYSSDHKKQNVNTYLDKLKSEAYNFSSLIKAYAERVSDFAQKIQSKGIVAAYAEITTIVNKQTKIVTENIGKKISAIYNSLHEYTLQRLGLSIQDIPKTLGEFIFSRIKKITGKFSNNFELSQVKNMLIIKYEEYFSRRSLITDENLQISEKKKSQIGKTTRASSKHIINSEVKVNSGVVEKSIARHQRKEKKLRMKHKERKRFYKQDERRFIKTKEIIIKPIRRKEKILFVEVVKFKKRKDTKERKNKKLTQEEKRDLRRKEKRLLRKKEKTLWKMLGLLLDKRIALMSKNKKERILKKRKEKLEKIHMMKKEKQTAKIESEHHTMRQEKRHVINFSVALIIWLLLRQPEKRQEVKVAKHEKLTKIVQKELAPWLILAIIRHLAMIREGGNRTVYKQKKAKKQVKQYYSASLPPQGVIFAFAS